MNTSECISILAEASKTPQHELIEQMLVYYDVRGVRDLSDEQISAYVASICPARRESSERVTTIPETQKNAPAGKIHAETGTKRKNGENK